MQFYSTKGISESVDLQEAVMRGLPDDNGLYMPEQLNLLPADFIERLPKMSFQEMAYEFASTVLKDCIDLNVLKTIVYDAINFEAPVVKLDDDFYCLELFHGPSLAFKDFGARFMARLMGHFVKDSNQKLTILVATSGDTGGAVAQGFLDTPGIEVIILYPSKKISELQEKQLTTLGSNITALEIEGTFDDCQKLVKSAFLDSDLRSKLNISSANSINLARLIPQAFYYLNAFSQVLNQNREVVFCVPSGNFGNVTAGLIAHKMGLPVKQFVAANNANDVFTEFRKSGEFIPRPSVPTYSNAMDVGNPSNLQRIQDLYQNNIQEIRADIEAYRFSDEETLEAIKELNAKYNYVACPHTAVAYLGMKSYFNDHGNGPIGIFLGTAHPSKFLDIVEPALNQKVEIPENLKMLMNRKKEAKLMGINYAPFKKYLLSRP